MALVVVDVHESSGTIMCAQDLMAKFVSHIIVMSELISRRDHGT